MPHFTIKQERMNKLMLNISLYLSGNKKITVKSIKGIAQDLQQFMGVRHNFKDFIGYTIREAKKGDKISWVYLLKNSEGEVHERLKEISPFKNNELFFFESTHDERFDFSEDQINSLIKKIFQLKGIKVDPGERYVFILSPDGSEFVDIVQVN